MEKYALLSILVAGVVLAFILGLVAQRLRLPPLVGYLAAGVLIGPHTPGFVGDRDLALQLAEIGVILLMFGVGLKFSLQDLWAVRKIALPGAVVQMATATALGTGLGVLLGLPVSEGVVLGLSVAVASTVVLLRALEERRLLKTPTGQLCVGWLVIEDIAIVLAIVALPSFAAAANPSAEPLWQSLGLTVLKITGFVVLMMMVGARVFPWILVQVGHTKSRELMALGTLAMALGLAAAAYALFDASFALGAFLAGVVLNGHRFSQRIAEDSQPLRDTFAVLFFVAVGMLFDPFSVLRQPLALLGLVAIIVVGKGVAAWIIASAFKLPAREGFLVAAALAQIGEFSFVLAGLGRQLGFLSGPTYDLILAAALISIAINPLLFLAAERFGQPAPAATPPATPQSGP